MKYDLSIFRLERYRAGRDPYVPQVLADRLDNGRTCAGATKTGQRFLVHLLKRKGVVPHETGGCSFLDRLLTGRVATENDVFIAFVASLSQVVQAMQAEDSDTDSDDERLAGVRIISLRLRPGTISLQLRLRYRSGTRENLTVPLNFLVA